MRCPPDATLHSTNVLTPCITAHYTARLPPLCPLRTRYALTLVFWLQVR